MTHAFHVDGRARASAPARLINLRRSYTDLTSGKAPMTDLSCSSDSSGNGSGDLVVRDEAVRHMTDARLVIAITSAEVDALAEVYDRRGQFVYGLGLHLCG